MRLSSVSRPDLNVFFDFNYLHTMPGYSRLLSEGVQEQR